MNLNARRFWYPGASLKYFRCGDSLIRYDQVATPSTATLVDAGTVDKRLGSTTFANVNVSGLSVDDEGNGLLLGFSSISTVKPAGVSSVPDLYPMAGAANSLSLIQPAFTVTGDAGQNTGIFQSLLDSFKYYPSASLSGAASLTKIPYYDGAVYLNGITPSGGTPVFGAALNSSNLGLLPAVGYGSADRAGENTVLGSPRTATVFQAKADWADSSAPSYPSWKQAHVARMIFTESESPLAISARTTLGLANHGLPVWRTYTRLSNNFDAKAGTLVGIHKAIKVAKLKSGSSTDLDWFLCNLTRNEVAAMCRAMASGMTGTNAAQVTAMATAVEDLASTVMFQMLCFDSPQEVPDIYQCYAIQKAFSDGAEQSDVDDQVVGATTLKAHRVACSRASKSATWMWIDDVKSKGARAIKITSTGATAPYFTYTAAIGGSIVPGQLYAFSTSQMAAIRAAQPMVFQTDDAILTAFEAQTGGKVVHSSAGMSAIFDADRVIVQPWKDLPGAWMKRGFTPGLQQLANVIRFGLTETAQAFA